MDKFIDIHVELHELQAPSGSLAAENNDRGEPSCDTELDSKPMSTQMDFRFEIKKFSLFTAYSHLYFDNPYWLTTNVPRVVSTPWYSSVMYCGNEC